MNIEQRINELQRQIDGLKRQTSSENDAVLQDRGFLKTYKPDRDPSTTDAGFRRDISLSGGAETITVPAYPTRWVKLQDGSNLWIPLHALDALY